MSFQKTRTLMSAKKSINGISPVLIGNGIATSKMLWSRFMFTDALLFASGLALSAMGCQRIGHASSASASPESVPPALPAPPAGMYIPPLAASVAVTPAGDIASLVERLKPTVVNITTSHTLTRAEEGEFSLPFPFPFFGPGPGPGGPGGPGPMPEGQGRTKALGTGFIIDPSGLVVTNAHVVQSADDIKVRLSDEREFPAKVVGKDTKLDVALLRLDGAQSLSAATLGDSDILRVGDWAIAIGNPFGLGHTVTLGIVSAKDRSIGAGPYDAFIQTDASINPGNSGGPLFNFKGEVVGIPTAIRQGAQGIGFAIPINAFKDVFPQLRDKGAVSRGKLGVHIQHVSEELAKGLGLDRARGALVADVEPASGGARAGLQPGDVIVQLDGIDVGHSEDLPRLVARHAPGSHVKLTYLRNGKRIEADTTLDVLKDEPDESEQGATPKSVNPKGKLGIEVETAPGNGGAIVRGLSPTSPAAGQLRHGDVIVEVDHQAIKTAAELVKRVEAASPGKVLLLRVKHGDATRFIAINIS